MMLAWLTQLAQAALVLALAPLLSGVTRKIRARLLRRQGPSIVQPYRDLAETDPQRDRRSPRTLRGCFVSRPTSSLRRPGWPRHWFPRLRRV